MNLSDYGFIPTMISNLNLGSGENKILPARVTAVHRERYELMCEHGCAFGRLKKSIYFDAGEEEFPTTGDFVLIEYNESGDCRIVKTLPRSSFFSRSHPTPGRGEQAVAANFDYVFILQSLNQDFNLRRLERYITISWQSGALPVVLLTKADLSLDFSEYVRAAEKTAPGVGVFAVSSKTGFGLDGLMEYLKPRKTIVFLGSSGVGKSSLVNALAGKQLMAVNEIREDDSKGRHTTTHRQLIMLPGGVMVIDTPGMRMLGMWDVTEGLGEAFGDVEEYLGKCKFSDCRHQSEPGCAVKAAIADGRLPRKRWESYLKLKQEGRFSDDKASAMQEKRKRTKDISRRIKQMQSSDYRFKEDSGH